MTRQNWGVTDIPTRHAPFGGATGDWNVEVLSVDWSGAAFVLAVSKAEGAAAEFTLTNQPAGTQGVSAAYDPNMVDPISGGVLGGTTISPQVNETSLEAITWGSIPAGEPLSLFWELLVTPIGGPQRQLCCGNFKLYPGVGD